MNSRLIHNTCFGSTMTEEAGNGHHPKERLSQSMEVRRRRGIIYGPVSSRRLGLSLGINVLPWGTKTCTFNCVYCEVGSAPPITTAAGRDGFPPIETVLAELELSLAHTEHLEAITFAGAGEPTLYPGFDTLVAGVRQLRDRHCPTAKIIVLSNGAFTHHPSVRTGLRYADKCIMKLDAGDEETFRQINRPAPPFTLRHIVDNLRQLDDIVIQTLLVDGPASNVTTEAFASYLKTLRSLRPTAVQLYTVSRPAPVEGIRGVPCEKIEELGRRIREETGIPIETYC